MKRLLIAVALALGLVITLAGNPMDSPTSVINDTQDQFASSKLQPAPTAIDTGPDVSFVNPAITTAGNFSGEVAADQYSATYNGSAIATAAYRNAKIANPTASARAPDQADHPAFDTALAKSYGEQAIKQLRPKSRAVLLV